jgi:rhamnosyl/mannosyltransferase
VTGLTVPPGDTAAQANALRRLLDDEELRARLGRQAQARALSTFTIPHMVEQTLAVYAEAIERHDRKRGKV